MSDPGPDCSSHPLQTVTFYGLDRVFRGPQVLRGRGARDGIKPERKTDTGSVCFLPSLRPHSEKSPRTRSHPCATHRFGRSRSAWRGMGLEFPAWLWEWELGSRNQVAAAGGVWLPWRRQGRGRPRRGLVTQLAGAGQRRVCWRRDGAGAVDSEGVGAAGAERARGARVAPRDLGLGPSNERRLLRSVTYPRARLWSYRTIPTTLKNGGTHGPPQAFHSHHTVLRDPGSGGKGLKFKRRS